MQEAKQAIILKHRDLELLRFEWLEGQGVRIVSVNKAAERFQPLPFRGDPTDENLWKWLTRRLLPKHRHAIEQALADPRFTDVFLFDAIILNTDRHMGNFGYLVDNDTNEIVGAAPIFDNGYGLFSLALDKEGSPHDEFCDLTKFTRRIMPALYLKWLGIPGLLTPGRLGKVAALRGFRFKRNRYYGLNDRRLSAIEDFLQNRVSQNLEYGEKADDFIMLKQKNDTVNAVSETSLALQIKESLKADPFITYDELSDLLQVPSRTLKRWVKKLRDAGEVRRTGSDKKGSWEVLK